MVDFYLSSPSRAVRCPHKNSFPSHIVYLENRDFTSKDTYTLK